MAQSDTVTRIVDAAAVLFSERGFAETSLRTITSTADVNLAAVNYHFGSKKVLIQAVFARYLTPFCEALGQSLTELQEQHGESITLSQLLDSLFHSLLSIQASGEGEIQRFMRLLGLAFTQSQAHLRRFMMQEYGQFYARFIELLSIAAPKMDPVAFYWRLYFMLGATVFTLSSFESIKAILKEDFDKDTSLHQAIELLIPAARGLIAVDDTATQG
ncbi:TetR/AcrR family transcriptional regulator [Marinibactrum halimedae]|uniref:TetR family transcriptional regulator n=1 Tax=Marinibactrum halimedae TaxID=1444977 RepID=A0AA37TBM7_9GAMM|nr:TetR/AcrR family transcriptional regulator [Marinibactrum halimedae]MCD9459210.1 TetR family transcriptional regulator [Marinibactrum halimedae]GLS27281.1 TetR family transcriptional regulator [Marinibactrum halimedae]